jgi:RND superfamily putative drug exporter
VFKHIGHFAFRRRRGIVAFYLLLVPVLVWSAATAFPRLRGGGFEVPDSESHQAFEVLENDIKVGGADILALWTMPDGTVDDIEPYTAAFEAIARIEKDPSVVSHVSWYETGAPQLVTKDKQRTFLMITLAGGDHERFEAAKRLAPLLEAPPMKLDIGGVVPVAFGVQRIIAEDLVRAEKVALPVTAVLLLLIFGSGASASLPLVLGVMSLLVSMAGLRALSEFEPVSVFSINIASLLGLGLAIDYSLFLVNRFREELAAGADVETAVVQTVATTGRAVAFSGVTVAASLLGLFFFPQMFLQSMAQGGILVVTGTATLSLTLLPALLSLLGPRVDSLRLPFVPRFEASDEGFWHRLASVVMRHPAKVAVAVLLPMLALGAPFLRFAPGFPDYRILPRDEPAYVANEILDREFDGDQMTPIDVVCTVKGDALSRDNLARLLEVSNKLVHIADGRHDMVEPKIVSGLFTLLPGVPTEQLFDKLSTPRAVLEKNDKTALMGIDAFARGSHMRFAILLDSQYNLPEALAVVQAIRALDVDGVDIKVGGPGAYLIDLKQNLIDRSPWMVATVMLVMFVVLFLVFGSVTLPLKAMFMNALSISASFGAIVWVFQDGRFHEALDYVPLGISDCTAPLLMFSIVFGLSMDYEVLILSRVQEEFRKTGDNTAAVATGLARTGRLITSAALLLVVVIGAFGTSKIVFMKSLGVGMALAILLDATIVRALLVPAAMKMMGHWNWWAPAPLARLWKKVGLEMEH